MNGHAEGFGQSRFVKFGIGHWRAAAAGLGLALCGLLTLSPGCRRAEIVPVACIDAFAGAAKADVKVGEELGARLQQVVVGLKRFDVATRDAFSRMVASRRREAGGEPRHVGYRVGGVISQFKVHRPSGRATIQVQGVVTDGETKRPILRRSVSGAGKDVSEAVAGVCRELVDLLRLAAGCPARVIRSERDGALLDLCAEEAEVGESFDLVREVRSAAGDVTNEEVVCCLRIEKAGFQTSRAVVTGPERLPDSAELRGRPGVRHYVRRVNRSDLEDDAAASGDKRKRDFERAL